MAVFWGFVFIACLTSLVVPAAAQRTVVQDAGGGRKVELVYDAAGQVTETRTLGADGKLLQKDVLDYPAGALVPQSTSTSYYPSGQVHKVTRNTYDNNSNFTGEFVQLYDESGKQIAGHRLTHDPQTNVYRCYGWNVAAQDYKAEACPAAEESAGAPEEAKKFTQDEVMQQLQHAREATSGFKTDQRGITAPAAAPGPREVGLILPALIRPGERVSGSVVEDPSRYDGIPELTVARVTLPFAAAGDDASLAGWVLEMSGEPPQRADGPIALTVPPGQVEVAIAFHPAGNPSVMISKSVSLAHGTHAKAKASTGYKAPAVCLKNQLCVVRGSFNGNSNKTFAAFEERPAKIIAETDDTAYIAVPERTEAGPRPLVIAEGTKAVAFPMVVGEFSIHPDRRDLPKGETLVMYPTVSGPEELPDAAWRPGNYPPWNLKEAQKVLPGFEMPRGGGMSHEEREAKEKQKAQAKPADADAKEEEEEGGGQILLVIKNPTPDVVTFRDSQSGTYVFHLKADSFSRGEFTYKFAVEANKAGTFGVNAYVIPFLAPVTGQEFSLPSGATGK